jgi:membrane dipeptidase
LLTFLLATTPLAAQTIVFDPHLDLPTSASATGWTGRGDPNAQFDLERATTGGLTIALLVPQEARDAASLAAAQQAFTVRDAAIHANPKLAGCARSPADVRRIVASGRIAIVESLLNAWPLGDDLDAFDRWRARGVSPAGSVHAGNDQFADSSRLRMRCRET